MSQYLRGTVIVILSSTSLFVSLRPDAVGEHVTGDGDGGVVVARVLYLHLALPPLLGVLNKKGAESKIKLLYSVENNNRGSKEYISSGILL